MFDRLIAFLTNPRVDLETFREACRFAETNVDMNDDGQVAIWELILLILRYLTK